MIEHFITLASTTRYRNVLQSVKPNVTHKSWIGYNKAKCYLLTVYSVTTDTFFFPLSLSLRQRTGVSARARVKSIKAYDKVEDDPRK